MCDMERYANSRAEPTNRETLTVVGSEEDRYQQLSDSVDCNSSILSTKNNTPVGSLTGWASRLFLEVIGSSPFWGVCCFTKASIGEVVLLGIRMLWELSSSND